MKIMLTFTEELLGTKAADPAVFETYIGSLHPSGATLPDETKNAEETEAALKRAAEQKEMGGTTVFHQRDGVIGIYDYQLKGFFKNSIGALNRFEAKERGGLPKLAAYKTKIDHGLFVTERFLPLMLPPGQACGFCERALRAETAQGLRVALTRSQTAPPGSWVQFELRIFDRSLKAYVIEALEYGRWHGLGQWRNSGKGRFDYRELE